MRRLLIAVLALLALMWAGTSQAQGLGCTSCGISYTGVSGLPLTGGTLTGPLLLPDGSAAAPSLARAASPNTGIYFDANPGLHISGAGSNRALFYGGGIEFSTNSFIIKTVSGTLPLTVGSSGLLGGVAKTLTDAAAATPVIRVPIATAGFRAGEVLWNAQSTDGTDHRTTAGVVRFAGVNKAGTPTCTVGVVGTDLTASSNANTLVCTWTNVVNTTNCDLSVTCTDNTAAPQTMTINVRANMTTTAAITFP